MFRVPVPYGRPRQHEIRRQHPRRGNVRNWCLGYLTKWDIVLISSIDSEWDLCPWTGSMSFGFRAPCCCRTVSE